MNKNDFIKIRVEKLNIEKQTVLDLINIYMANDPEYPDGMLQGKIIEINSQIEALLAELQ